LGRYAAISSDDHLQEPITLWEERLPRALVSKGPRLVELENGGHAFQIGDTPPKPIDVLVAAGKSLEEKREQQAVRWEHVHPGFYDPEARLADMDRDSLWASVMYPNMTLDVMMNQVDVDPEAKLPILQVYNDHMSEFCATDPNRLIGYALLPTQSPEQAVAEMERVRKLDHIPGVLLPVKPDLSDWVDEVWEPVWAAAVDLGLVLSVHGGKPRWLPRRSELAGNPRGMGMYFHCGYTSVIETFTHLFWSGCFDRHRELRVVSVEGDIGWLPHWKLRAEKVFWKFGVEQGFKSDPSDWFGHNFLATFESDPVGIRLIDVIGEDMLMWASDYPHSASSFPNSVQHIEEHFGDLSEATRRKITWDTVAKLYDIAPPPAD
jgi:predicted TIM-barrel fold metal-dependent hydrolase